MCVCVSLWLCLHMHTYKVTSVYVCVCPHTCVRQDVGIVYKHEAIHSQIVALKNKNVTWNLSTVVVARFLCVQLFETSILNVFSKQCALKCLL